MEQVDKGDVVLIVYELWLVLLSLSAVGL